MANTQYHEKTKAELDADKHMGMGSRRLLERLWDRHSRIVHLLTLKNGTGDGRDARSEG